MGKINALRWNWRCSARRKSRDWLAKQPITWQHHSRHWREATIDNHEIGGGIFGIEDDPELAPDVK